MNLSKTAPILPAPPGIPLNALKAPPRTPVMPPPAPPGYQPVATAPTLASGFPSGLAPPPSAPKKKERRMELAGLEPGDPLSTYHLMMLGIQNTTASLAALVQKFAWVIPVAIVVWSILGWYDTFKMMRILPALSPLWLFLDRFVLIVIFITATYNNFIAKAVYMTLIYRVGIPMGLRFKTEGPQKVIGEFAAIVPNFKANHTLSGASSTGLLVGFIGAGVFISNVMTRNNSIDKVAVSIAIAVSLFKALSDGPKSIPFMTGRVVMKDFFVAMKKPSPVRNHHIYVAVFGLACGFLCCLLLAWLRKPLGDSIGYILGALAMIAGAGIAVSQAKGTGNN